MQLLQATLRASVSHILSPEKSSAPCLPPLYARIWWWHLRSCTSLLGTKVIEGVDVDGCILWHYSNPGRDRHRNTSMARNSWILYLGLRAFLRKHERLSTTRQLQSIILLMEFVRSDEQPERKTTKTHEDAAGFKAVLFGCLKRPLYQKCLSEASFHHTVLISCLDTPSPWTTPRPNNLPTPRRPESLNPQLRWRATAS